MEDSIFAGLAGGLTGGLLQVGTGIPLLAGAGGGAAAAWVAGGSPGEGALYGMGATIIAGAVDSFSPTGQRIDRTNPLPAGTVVALRGQGFWGRLWPILLGDSFSHAAISLGDGRFADVQPGDVTGQTGKGAYHDRGYIQASMRVDVSKISTYYGRSYGLLAGQSVCTTFCSLASGGQIHGLVPGQMIYNTLGYRAGYLYYNFGIYGE